MGLLTAGATAALYLMVVVVTTPNLPPWASISAAILTNPIVIGATGGAIGAQVFFSSYAKSIGCRFDNKGLGAGSGGTALGSFFSFFSLVPLGCCGSWLFVLSLLPSIFGSTFSVFLIEYSRPLSYAAAAAVFGFAAISGLRLHRRMKRN
ncbi:MAG TPA: hypothetical protein VJM08_04020 [Anaerolineales bacterium]|nr:hypothetical protein [Anaerolineales bacterium]